MAADVAVIDYDNENLEPPILSLEDAVERGSFFHVPRFLYSEQVGDFSKEMAEADNQILYAEVLSILCCRFCFLCPIIPFLVLFDIAWGTAIHYTIHILHPF